MIITCIVIVAIIQLTGLIQMDMHGKILKIGFQMLGIK